MALGTFTMSCNHHLYQVPKHFCLPRTKPCPHQQPLSTPAPSSWQPRVCFLFLWICLFWTFHINGIIDSVALSVWLLSLSIVFSRFTRVLVRVRTSLLFAAE